MTKNYISKMLSRLVCGLAALTLMLMTNKANAQLQAGTSYTIDNTIPASATNFRTFQAFFSQIYNNSRNDGGPLQGVGVAGAGDIEVNVKAGVSFNEQVTVYAHATINASRRVVVKGNGAKLTWNASSAARHTMLLSGADFYTIENLNIEGTNASYAYVLRLTGQADNNIVRKCTISAPNYNYVAQTNNIAATTSYTTALTNSTRSSGLIVLNADAANLARQTQAAVAKNNLFEDNLLTGPDDNSTLTGPSFGVFEQGSSAATTGQNYYINNEIRNTSAGGIMMNFTKAGTKIIGNKFRRMHRGPFQIATSAVYYHSISIGMPYLNFDASKDIEIIGNDIRYIGRADLNINPYQNVGISVYGFNGSTGTNTVNPNSNKILIEGNYIVNCVVGNSNYAYGYFYGIASYYAKSVIMINNVIGNDRVRNSGTYCYSYSVYWYYGQGGAFVNNTVFNNLDLQNTGYYFNTYVYGYSGMANVASPVDQNAVRVENNIFYHNMKNVGSSHYHYGYIYYSTSFRNNLVYYKPTPTPSNGDFAWYYFGYIGTNGSTVNSLDIKTMNSYDANTKGNIEENPNFVDIGNLLLMPTSANTIGAGYDFNSKFLPNGVEYDILGNPRNPEHPTIGAFETEMHFSISGDFDGGAPYELCGGDKRPVNNITVKSSTGFEYENVRIGYQLNNKPVIYKEVGSLLPGQSKTVDFDQIADFTGAPGNSVLKVFVANYDSDRSDDTLTFNIYVGRGPFGGILTTNPSTVDAISPEESGEEYWITIPGTPINLNITSPTNYSNSAYGTDYDAVTSARIVPSGIPLPASSVTYSHNPVTGGIFTIDPPDLPQYVDSIMEVTFRLRDFNTGCDSTFYRYVKIAPYGVPDFKIPSEVCMGNTVELENMSTVPSGYLNYEWDFGNGAKSSNTNGKQYYDNPGSYQVTLKTTTVPYGFVKSVTKTVVISEGPVADFEFDSKCFGIPVSFLNTSTSTVGAPNYSWDFGDGQISSLESPTIMYANKGLYEVTLTAEKNGCASSMTKTIAMFEQPVADFNLPTNFCSNDELEFVNTSQISEGKIGYLWTFEQNEYSTVKDGIHAYSNPGSKSVKLVVRTPLGCVDSIVKNINILPGPSAEFVINGECQDEQISFVATDAALSGTTYNWEIDGVSENGLATLNKQYSDIGAHNVELSVQYMNGCSNSTSQNFVINASSKADFTVEDICSNSEMTFENKSTFTYGSADYIWNLGDGTLSNDKHPKHTYTSTGNVVVTLEASINGKCPDEITKTVTVNQSPERCDFVANYDGDKGLRAYKFEPTDGNNVGAENGISYTWYYGRPGAQQITNIGNYDYDADGVYTITMRAESAAGCFCESSQQLVIDRTNVSDISSNSFNVYPNPSNGIFNIEVENASTSAIVEVFDVIGNKIQSYNTSEMSSNNWSIDLSNYADGIYMIRYSADNFIATKKVRLIK